MGNRTDLAMEAEALWRRSAGETTELSGVKARRETRKGVPVYTVQILDRQGEQALGKPVGTYTTLTLPESGRPQSGAVEALGEVLRDILQIGTGETVLAVGLGNRNMTADAVGPLALDRLLVTRHLGGSLSALFRGLRPVAALAPGVLAATGVESAEIVRALVDRIRPDRVIAVDALAAADRSRLCTTVQVTDAGIVPGSGVGNSRAAFTRQTLGVPVCAVGVPTVMDLRAVEGCRLDQPMLVTHRDVDERVRRLAGLIAAGMNRALFPEWSDEEIAQFVE